MDGGDERAGLYHSKLIDCTYQSDWGHTSLQPYIEMVDVHVHVRGLMQETVPPCSVYISKSFPDFTHLLLSIGGKNKLDCLTGTYFSFQTISVPCILDRRLCNRMLSEIRQTL